MLRELSDKQKDSLRRAVKRLNFWVGAVRSGKSFSALLEFIEFIMSPIKGEMAIIGKTEDALKRNVISELVRLIGSDVKYYSGKREVVLWDRKIYVIGANDDRAEGKIRGMTLAGALIDEGTLIPENFFKMLLSRLSIDGARLFCTTNPDSPFHWLKRDFLNRAEELDLEQFHFVLDDNPSLSDEYKNNLKREYQGLWYKRFIDGEWVLAEGSIYDFFDESIHCVEFPPAIGQSYIVGIDYGTTNPCSFELLGYNPDKYPNMWFDKEYYWCSKEHLRQKTDAEYCDDLKKFIHGYPVRAVLIDPSAASFIAECRKQGVQNIVECNNDVLDGIRFMSQMLTNGTLKVAKRCSNLIKEFGTYVWDEQAAQRGEEKPKKVNDHSVDAARYAIMYFFDKNLGNETTAATLRDRYNKAMGLDNGLPSFFRDTYRH